MDQELKKRCSKCKEYKALTEFSKNGTRRDGLQGMCKDCHRKWREEHRAECNEYYRKWREEHRAERNEQSRKWREEHRERNNEYQQKYYAKHRAERNEQKRKWREEHPEKVRAHRILNKAIKSGEIIRPKTCSKCKGVGTEDNPIQGHHPDYSKPLQVIWLCQICHSRLHNAEREKR